MACSLFWFIAVSATLQLEHSRKMSASFEDYFYLNGFLMYGDLESMWVFFRPWKTASSGWRITVSNSWTAGLPNRLRKEKAVSPQWASWRYQHLPVLASPSTAPTQMCSRSSRSHGASFTGGDLRERGRMGKDEYKSKTSSLCPHELWIHAQSRPASLKYVELLMILIPTLLFYLTWNSRH